VKGIAEMVHEVEGAMLVVDAVAYAPHRRIDVKELGVDFYAFSWYKVYGPHISMLYGRNEVHDRLTSLGHYFNPTSSLKYKLDLASSNYECTQSIPIIVDYFGPDPAKSWAAIEAHEQKVASVLLGYLTSRQDVTIYGESSASSKWRVPTVSFTVEGWKSDELVEIVGKESRFGFRWGAFYSNRLVEEVLGLGKDGVIRVSMVHYNTMEEINGFIKKLDEVLARKK